MGKPTLENGTLKRKREEEEEVRAELSLRCEWVECDFITNEIEAFLTHVEEHQPFIEFKEDVDKNKNVAWYCCMWDSCEFNSINQQTTSSHINYHAFHTRIKIVATVILNKNKNLDCHLDYANRNIIPIIPDTVCKWRSCEFSTNNFARFLKHVKSHVTGQPRRQNHATVLCNWGECTKINKNMSKLLSHVRSHTQEKLAACPVCGAQFSSTTKFTDHCARQAPPERKLYKCSYCKKNFPSERILQDHIRLHVNQHKCPLCDMTCPFLSSLAIHIRYRHVSSRPYKCSFCDHRAITQNDLKSHCQSHCSENVWVCDQFECNFSCRSKNGLTSHNAKVHQDLLNEYGCHICDARFFRGSRLTVHLKNKHSYRWASGQSRFRYIKDDSGVHRLQTVRYESVEVTEQIMANETQRRPNRFKRFTCATVGPEKLVITEEESAEVEDFNFDIDDPPKVKGEDGSDDNISIASMKSPSIDTESEYGESLRQHLGLQGGFIEVLKP